LSSHREQIGKAGVANIARPGKIELNYGSILDLHEASLAPAGALYAMIRHYGSAM
jgi:hypothetical protein